MSTPPIRVNLGSGNEPMKGWINVDRRAVQGVDVVSIGPVTVIGLEAS